MTTPKSSGFQPVVSVSKNSDILVNLHDKAGKWTFGDYYTGFSKKLGRNLMIKMVDLTKYPLKKSTLDTEIAILQKLKSCPYATEFMEYQYYNKSLTITTENYNGGNLREYLNKNAPIPEDQAIRLITQLVCGLKALHQLRFIHADVRPENILLHEQDGKITLKVSNFIFVRKYDGDRSANFPVPFDSLYRAPEVLTENLYYPESDIWSIGVIFHEMLYGALPWSGKTKDELRDNIINQRLNLESRPGVSDTSIEFIYRCLNRETKKRIDWKTIGEHRLLFRALFMKDDGTYKLYNDEYKEFSPSKRNLMFGIRIAGGSVPGTPQNSRFDNTLKSGAGRPGFQTTKGGVDLDASGFSKALKYSSSFNLKMDQTPKLDAKLDSSTVKFKPEEIVSNLEGQQKDDTIPLDINIRIDEPVVEGEDEKESEVEGVPGESEKAELIETKTVPLEGNSVDVKTDPSFYPHFAARVGETEDYYTAKNLNTDTIGEKGPFSKKSFVKPFKWLANKAEIVSEIYELASRNKKHCCYEKIIELLNEETNSWNTINLVANMQKQFADSVESSSKKEQNKTMVWPKQGKASQSVAKSEKSKKLAALVEEIVASLTNNSENAKSNNEDLVQIAADFKVLREFDEIGDNVMKELNAMKNTLVVFSRRKDHTHIRYLLVVRNLA